MLGIFVLGTFEILLLAGIACLVLTAKSTCRSNPRAAPTLVRSGILVVSGIVIFLAVVRFKSDRREIIPQNRAEIAAADLQESITELEQAREKLHQQVHGTIELPEPFSPPTVPEVPLVPGAAVGQNEVDQTADTLPVEPSVKAEEESASVGRLTLPNGDVILLDLSEGVIEDLIRQSGGDAVQSLAEDLPEGIQRIYRLVPLTTSGPGLLPAGSSTKQPLKVVEGIRTVADAVRYAIVTGRDDAANRSVSNAAAALLAEKPADSTDSTDATSSTDATGSEVLTSKSQVGELLPDWVNNPDGGRLVVETQFHPSEEDDQELLLSEIDNSLLGHLKERHNQWLAVHHAGRLPVRFSLTPETARQCIVARVEQSEVLETSAGPQSMIRTIALVEFPEAVDKQAFDMIRKAVQRERMFLVVLVTILIGLSVLTGGIFVRTGIAAGKARKVMALAGLALTTLPLALVAVAAIGTTIQGDPVEVPWEPEHATIDLAPGTKPEKNSSVTVSARAGASGASLTINKSW
ncbi:MAG: hypothetical protein R3C20_24995 [Planctomycetaceae bacterium]